MVSGVIASCYSLFSCVLWHCVLCDSILKFVQIKENVEFGFYFIRTGIDEGKPWCNDWSCLRVARRSLDRVEKSASCK